MIVSMNTLYYRLFAVHRYTLLFLKDIARTGEVLFSIFIHWFGFDVAFNKQYRSYHNGYLMGYGKKSILVYLDYANENHQAMTNNFSISGQVYGAVFYNTLISNLDFR